MKALEITRDRRKKVKREKEKWKVKKHRKSQRATTDVLNFTFCVWEILYLVQFVSIFVYICLKQPTLYRNICITFFVL